MPEFKGSKDNSTFHVEIVFTPEEKSRDFRSAIGAASTADASMSHMNDKKLFSGEDNRANAIDALSKVIPLADATAFIDGLIEDGEAHYSF